MACVVCGLCAQPAQILLAPHSSQVGSFAVRSSQGRTPFGLSLFLYHYHERATRLTAHGWDLMGSGIPTNDYPNPQSPIPQPHLQQAAAGSRGLGLLAVGCWLLLGSWLLAVGCWNARPATGSPSPSPPAACSLQSAVVHWVCGSAVWSLQWTTGLQRAACA
jgi:hypothetical protein